MKRIKIDYTNSEILVYKTFAQKASIVGTSEYNELKEIKANFEGFKVKVHTLAKKKGKETYKGLTYDEMEKYILSHRNSKMNMRIFEAKKALSKIHSIRYPAIKQWFLETYPEVKEYGLPKEETDELANAA